MYQIVRGACASTGGWETVFIRHILDPQLKTRSLINYVGSRDVNAGGSVDDLRVVPPGQYRTGLAAQTTGSFQGL